MNPFYSNQWAFNPDCFECRLHGQRCWGCRHDKEPANLEMVLSVKFEDEINGNSIKFRKVADQIGDLERAYCKTIRAEDLAP